MEIPQDGYDLKKDDMIDSLVSSNSEEQGDGNEFVSIEERFGVQIPTEKDAEDAAFGNRFDIGGGECEG